MDAFTLVANCVWAAVALCTVGVVAWYVFTARTRSEVVTRVADACGRAARLEVMFEDLDRRVKACALVSYTHDLSDNIISLKKEVAEIRAGLEKLKAIPPKQPRL